MKILGAMGGPTCISIVLSFFAVVAVVVGEPIRLEDATLGRGTNRQLLQFGGQTLPPDFVVPEMNCSRQGQFPYMVSVRDRAGDHLCGGVVIAEDAVLTAAHCIDVRFSANSNPTPMVYLGGLDRDNPIEKRQTVRPLLPKGWTGDPLDGSDIAILKLDKPTCLKPIPALGNRMKPNQEVNFLGYGRSSIGGSFSYILGAGKFRYLTNKNCSATFDLKTKLTFNDICIKGPNSAGVCVGDDGGPAMVRPTPFEFKDRLVGIASYATGDCTDADAVTIFTRVKAHLKWIRESLKD
ncbi:hypothetical protein BSKO_08130 [Bryopsis sp. KO-2023]|nr:hypothetical protein BSKO_08130 [Bryopsis sp. KO-2023]